MRISTHASNHASDIIENLDLDSEDSTIHDLCQILGLSRQAHVFCIDGKIVSDTTTLVNDMRVEVLRVITGG